VTRSTGTGNRPHWTPSAAIGADALIGGRGAVSQGGAAVTAAIAQTRNFLNVMIREVSAAQAKGGVAAGPRSSLPCGAGRRLRPVADLEHCLPFERVPAVGRAERGGALGLDWKLVPDLLVPFRSRTGAPPRSARPTAGHVERRQCSKIGHRP